MDSTERATLPPVRQPERDDTSIAQQIRRYLAPLGAGAVLLVKYLAPALKFIPMILKTGGSMLITVAFYAVTWGVWYAVGLVLLILVHECGHLLAAKRLGLKVGAPVFIPFMGAFIALKEAPRNAWVEAQVGIGGPLLGSVGAVVCAGIFWATNLPIFGALAYTGFLLNLFNLIPVGVLDGGRIVTALSPWLSLVGFGILVVMTLAHPNFLLILILLLSLPRLFSLFRAKSKVERRYYEVTSTQRLTMAVLYFGLVALLVLGMNLQLVPTASL